MRSTLFGLALLAGLVSTATAQPRAYDLGSFLTTEDCGGASVEVTNQLDARVTYFELNATAVVAASAPALSGWALILLGMLLPSVAVFRPRWRGRAKVCDIHRRPSASVRLGRSARSSDG